MKQELGEVYTTSRNQVEMADQNEEWIAYDPRRGARRFATRAEAQKAAQKALDVYRSQSGGGVLWACDVEHVLVARVTHEVRLIACRSCRGCGDELFDYAIHPYGAVVPVNCEPIGDCG